MASPFRSGRAPGSLARRIDHRAATDASNGRRPDWSPVDARIQMSAARQRRHLAGVLRYDDLCPSACSTARRAITTTRWARYSLSAWMSELRPEGAIEIRISAADEKFAANASSISLDRNTTGPAPVTATRTLPPNLPQVRRPAHNVTLGS